MSARGSSNVSTGWLLLAMLLVLALSQLSMAECVRTTKILSVPAVLNDNRSEMVLISVETMPGRGEAFASVFPAVGYETQGSERTASAIAFAAVGEKECDVLLRFATNDGVDHVDGPSAGGAMTLLMLSALTGKELRDDFSMTGTIETDGAIGPVGGIPLKAEAVAKSGKPLFLVPTLSSSDLIGVLLVKNSYDITVIEAPDIDTAFGIATSSATPEERLVLQPEGSQEYSKASVSHWYSDRMREITSGMVGSGRDGVGSSTLPFMANFESRAINSEKALAADQYYTAANIAFLLSIDEGFANFSRANAEREYAEVERCLDDFEVKDLSLENFEVVGPAQARYVWARTRLPSELPQDNGFVAGMFEIYYDTLNAKQWCIAGTEMNQYDIPGINGSETYFDSELLMNYTDEVLWDVNDAFGDASNADAEFHLETAEEAFSDGLYVAALVDAAYVQSYVDIMNITVNDSDDALSTALSQNYTYVWPQMLRNHAEAISDGDRLSAVRIGMLAYRMNQYFTDAEAIARENVTRHVDIVDITGSDGIGPAAQDSQLAGIPPELIGGIGLCLLAIVIVAALALRLRDAGASRSRKGRRWKGR